MDEEMEVVCCKCRQRLVEKPVRFTYLGREFNHVMPCCPKCGQVLITAQMARGKMAQVEMMLEGK